MPDRNGNFARSAGAALAAVLGWSAFGLAVAERASAQSAASFQYDAVGNRTLIAFGDGIESRFTYDARNRVSTVETVRRTQVIQSHRYTYDASGLRVRVESYDPDGVQRETRYTYDGMKRLATEQQFAAGAVVFDARYAYDRVGNRTRAVIDGATVDYAYDANDRLIREVATGGASPGITTYTYDERGNRLSRSAAGLTQTYDYDDANRLTRFADGRGHTTNFTYDEDGLLVETATYGVEPLRSRHYLWDRALPIPQVIEESAGDANDRFMTDTVYSHANDLIRQYRDGRSHHVIADGFGSTRALIAENGEVTDTFRYDAFGNLIARTGITRIEHLYRGEALEPSTGLYYLRARWFDPRVGQFTQADPVEGRPMDPRTRHEYAYGKNDPVNRVDPAGTSSLAEVGAALVVASTLAVVAVTATDWWGRRARPDGVSVPGLWDIIAMTTLTHYIASGAEALPQTKPARREEDAHHTIPIYLCGSAAQPLSLVKRAQHVPLHAGLAGITAVKAYAEDQADIKLGGRRSAFTMDLAETPEGRAFISGLIGQFYTDFDWRVEGNPPIGTVFDLYRPQYIAGWTSLPTCKRRASSP